MGGNASVYFIIAALLNPSMAGCLPGFRQIIHEWTGEDVNQLSECRLLILCYSRYMLIKHLQ